MNVKELSSFYYSRVVKDLFSIFFWYRNQCYEIQMHILDMASGIIHCLSHSCSMAKYFEAVIASVGAFRFSYLSNAWIDLR